MRVVIDSNTLVSALLIKRSTPRQAFDKAMAQGDVLLSTATINELNEVLSRRKFRKYISDAERMLFIETLRQQSLLIAPTDKIDVCRDSKDNKFLELATSPAAPKSACIFQRSLVPHRESLRQNEPQNHRGHGPLLHDASTG